MRFVVVAVVVVDDDDVVVVISYERLSRALIISK